MYSLHTAEVRMNIKPNHLTNEIKKDIERSILNTNKDAYINLDVYIENEIILVIGEIDNIYNMNIKPVVLNSIKKNEHKLRFSDLSYMSCIIVEVINDQGPVLYFVNKKRKDTEMKPLSYVYAQMICREMEKLQKDKLAYLSDCALAEVTIEYKDDLPTRIDTVLVSAHLSRDIGNSRFRNDIMHHVIERIIPDSLIDQETIFGINPSGMTTLDDAKAIQALLESE